MDVELRMQQQLMMIEQRLAEARAEVEGEWRGATCSCIPLDVTWPQARLQAALAPVLEQGGVDVLILSAGDSLPNAFVDTTEADWERREQHRTGVLSSQPLQQRSTIDMM